MHHSFHKNIRQQKILVYQKVLIVSEAPNQYIRHIFERSCDTEDWRDGYWKFSLAITGINYILKYIQIKNSYFEL